MIGDNKEGILILDTPLHRYLRWIIFAGIFIIIFYFGFSQAAETPINIADGGYSFVFSFLMLIICLLFITFMGHGEDKEMKGND